MASIHPTALVDPGAIIAEDVEIGPYCIVEADCTLGAGTVLRNNAIIRRHTTLGEGNYVDSFAVLGGLPQDLKYDASEVSYLRIGDHNTFREGVTISRATGEGLATVVGSHCYWMANSHAGHNATIEDDVILPNGALVAGHVRLGRGAILSGNTIIHQFVWIGEKVMFQGGAAAGMHVPPFVMCAEINNVAGLNVIGLRRAQDLTDEDRDQIKEAFRITYRNGLTPADAVGEMDSHTEWGAAAGRFRDFVRDVLAAEKPYNRGLAPMLGRSVKRRGGKA
ncbi:MAG: acyl-ACP--UDP-N-acetylglucosamine O-acyltransferase [Planctomycetota bacterium]|jgi:UDP-N-acetylglucosamine acyltransferase